MDNITHANRLKELVDIKTVSSEFHFDKEAFDAFFLKTKELFPTLFKVGEIHRFNGGFYLIVKGESSIKPVVYMNHHDVVETSGKWVSDPFNAVIKDGCLYGRGAIDTKGGFYCMMQAMEELLVNGFKPKQDVYLLSDSNEEINGDGANFITQEFQKQGIQFEYVLDEGGMITKDIIPLAKGEFALVALGEKPIMEVKFTARSKGGHSSTPPKNSPLVRLSKLVLAIENSKKFKTYINPATRCMLQSFGKKCKGFVGVVLRHPTFFYPILKPVLANLSDMTRSLLRTTIAFTYCKGSECFNVIPPIAEVVANVRVAHHQGNKNVIDTLDKYAKKYGCEFEVLNPPFDCVITDVNAPQLKMIKEAIEKTFDDVTVTPYVASSASDARFFSRCSKAVFGFVPFKITNEQIATIHGDNEFVKIDDLGRAINFYKELMSKN